MDTSVRFVSKHARYARDLRVKIDTAFHLLRSGIYALSDCDDNGELTKKYVIITVKKENNILSFACSCENDNCLHIKELKILRPDPVFFLLMTEHQNIHTDI